MPRIKTNAQLRGDLLEAYELLRADPKRVVQVGELANTAGKVFASAKMEIEYHLLRKKIANFPEIPFMEGDR